MPTERLPALVEPSLLALAPGFLLWSALTIFGAVAAWALAAALLWRQRARGPEGAAERGDPQALSPAAVRAETGLPIDALVRWQAALLIFFATVLTAVQAPGLLHALGRPQVALLGLALFSAQLVAALRLCPRERLAALARAELRAPLALAARATRNREVAFLAVPCALFVLAVASAMVWYFQSWTWDPLWYHTPITNFAIQEHRLWVDTPNDHASGFARGLELLSVWNVLLPRDTKFDDAAQLPFALLGLAALASWMRRLGAAPALAAGLASLWLLFPALFLELPSTHNDVACAALFVCGFAALTATRFGPAERWLALGALALYAALKFTGLFHLLLLAPLILLRLGLELRRARRDHRARPLLLELGALLALCAWLAAPCYVHNLAAYGNPLWPIRVQLPFSARALPGLFPAAQEWNQPFFLTPGSFAGLWRSWYGPYPALWPDVRGGGFGPLFRWLLLPACGLCALSALLAPRLGLRLLTRAAAVTGLFALAVVVPAQWWPRFTLAAPAAGLAAVAVLHGLVPWRWPRALLSLAAVALGVAGFLQGFPGLGPLGDAGLRARAFRAGHVERTTLQLSEWMWPDREQRLRETDLHAGDAVAVDRSVFFLGELWTWDLRNRVVYVEHPLDLPGAAPARSTAAADAGYLAALRAADAAWAAVRPGSHADRVLRAEGATFLFVGGRFGFRVSRVPATLRPVRGKP